MTKVLIDLSVVEQALEALEDLRVWHVKQSMAVTALRAALAQPVREPVESALQAVAEKIGDQCAVWYGIGARDVEEVLREAEQHGLVHSARAVAADRADLCAELDRLRQVQRSLSDKLAAERERCAAWLEREGRHDMAYGIRHAMHCGPNVKKAAPPQRPAEPVEEPVAYVDHADGSVIWKRDRLPGGSLLYTAPLQRPAADSEKNNAPAKLSVPHEWHTELATTCFARSYNGEGSYYCPHCDINAGSVWLEDAWRPTKWQAICDKCRELFEE